VPDDYEMVPYFCLPSNHLAHGVIAESCRSCFDYPNALADLVVGYMGVPYYHVPMTRHPQYVTVRNERGREMIDIVRDRLDIVPTVSSGDRKSVVMQTVEADDAGFYGRGPESPAPPLVGNLIATILEKVGCSTNKHHKPRGEFRIHHSVVQNPKILTKFPNAARVRFRWAPEASSLRGTPWTTTPSETTCTR